MLHGSNEKNLICDNNLEIAPAMRTHFLCNAALHFRQNLTLLNGQTLRSTAMARRGARFAALGRTVPRARFGRTAVSTMTMPASRFHRGPERGSGRRIRGLMGLSPVVGNLEGSIENGGDIAATDADIGEIAIAHRIHLIGKP